MADTVQTTGAPIPLAASSNGRASGKPWKSTKTPTVRSHLQRGVKTTSWEQRKEKETKEAAIRQLQQDLKDEKQADFTRRKEITLERRRHAEERRAAEELKAKVGAKKAARLKKKAGRTKLIKH